MPDFNEVFIIECDASGTGIGAVLMQLGRPIAYFSCVLKGRNQKLSTYEKELMGIILSTKKWHQYLLGRSFIIRTDHQSLKYLLEQKIHTGIQNKWLAKLHGFDYRVEYKPGKLNKVADGLSRMFEEENVQLSTFSYVQNDWLTDIIRMVATDPYFKDVENRLIQGDKGTEHYSSKGGIYYYKGRIVISPTAEELKLRFIQDNHSSPMSGHSGIHRTLHRLKRSFYWQGMRKGVQEFVQNCEVCQRNKGENVASPGLLQPLPIPDNIWEDISMDFITGLPKSKGKTAIFVVVDRLSKYAHFFSLSHPYTAQSVAQIFFDGVFKLHGLPKSIISDRDTLFTSLFWKELFKLQGSQLKFSTAYHPQTDGQTESVNKSLEGYLRCFCCHKPHEWDRWLSLAEFWYNTTWKISTHTTPYEAVYGRTPPTLLHYIPKTAKVQAVEEALFSRDITLQFLKDSLQHAREQMKKFSDKHRSERTFEIGDWVYLKLQPYRQISASAHKPHKLSPKYYGPYQITKKIGAVAYELALPVQAQIHPVFHVSQLKKRVGQNVVTHSDFPSYVEEIIDEPETILDRRSLVQGRKLVTQVLIKWKQRAHLDATWESYWDLVRRFPTFDLETRSKLRGRELSGLNTGQGSQPQLREKERTILRQPEQQKSIGAAPEEESSIGAAPEEERSIGAAPEELSRTGAEGSK